AGTGAEARGPGSAPEPAPLADGEANGAVVSGRSAAEPVRTGAAGRPRGDAPVALEDIPLEEQTPEMRWPPSSWVRVTNIVRHSTGEPIEGIEVGDVGHVTAALSQTLVLMFPTRDNRREVLHIDGIEAVDAPADRGQR
ncbi:MAG TPA: hypothetical protein VMW49_08740, partial [Candidatus Dormibacteraeota bacterium]|nr:hypothetical protein [Candidatus Dormibacteraeota bacterium]